MFLGGYYHFVAADDTETRDTTRFRSQPPVLGNARMQQDPFSQNPPVHPPEPPAIEPVAVGVANVQPTSPAESSAAEPATVTHRDLSRLKRMLWVFGLLLFALIVPDMVARVQYALTAAQERARVDVARENLQDFNLDQLSNSFRLLAQSVCPSVVNIHTHRNRGHEEGSGVIIDDDGYIVTNFHVVAGAKVVQIQLNDGRLGKATVIGADDKSDVAVLKTDMTDLIPAQWGDSDQLNVGDMVWAVGSPFGLQKSITFGILSAKERRGITHGVYQEFLQTDAAVNPGNSGGPLVNIEGKVVGINTAIVGPTYQGISFSIPSSLAKDIYLQLRRDGRVERGYLGIGPRKVNDRSVQRLGLERNQGVLIGEVKPNSPAEVAGMKQNDVILSWNGVEYSDPTVMSRAIAGTAIGSQVEVDIARGTRESSERLRLTVKVIARPPDSSF